MNKGLLALYSLAVGAGCVVALDFYSDTELRRFDRLCREDARVIVHNQAAWAVHRQGADDAFARRVARFGPTSERALIEHVDGFKEVYGISFKADRTRRDGEMVRDDIIILREGRPVAQYVDYVWFESGLAGPSIVTCTGLHPQLFHADGTLQQ